MNDRANKRLLPEFIKKPIMMLWLFMVPQFILLLLNLKSFWVISKEVPADKIHIAWSIFGFEVLLLVSTLSVGQFYRVKKTTVHQGWNLIFLLTHIGYLWYVSSHLWQVIPSNIEPWILNVGDVFFSQFTLMMPGLFYAGLRLACFETTLKARSDFGWSLLMAVFAPAFFYVLFISTRGYSWLPNIISQGFIIGLTVLAFVGIIRAVVMAYNAIYSRGELIQIIFASVVCLAGPIGGLLLNRTIPFPAYFQIPWVYVLTIINGLIVLIPSARKADGHGILLFARALTFPFTFYFFLVFLPFLPLALPAIIALGSGFLILVPVVLFLFHTKKLFGDFKICVQASGVVSALVITLTGLSVLPGYFTLEALKDKASLAKALQYVYAPDYTHDFSFKGSVKSVKRTLIKLKEFKEGIQLPYLSGFYNDIVFEDMVLPDKKIEYMYKLFTGEELPNENVRGRWEWGDWGRSRRGWRNTPVRNVDRQVDLVSVDIHDENVGSIIKSRVRLEMHNTGKSGEAEFFREIHLPVGVLITGFTLKVGEAFVPGQIFEKRTTMWVYHMIKDSTRRDPGLLTYKSPTQVDFNVYPFILDQTRVAEIEFQFPRGQKPVVFLGDQQIALGKENNEVNDVPVVVKNRNEVLAILSKEAIAKLPRFKRQPYFHFILDSSKTGSLDANGYRERINDVRKRYPNIKSARVTAANFNIEDLTTAPVTLDGLNETIAKSTLPRQGKLDVGRVIRQELMKYHAKMNSRWQEYPLFVLITGDAMNVILPVVEDLAFFSRYLPDCNDYLTIAAPNKMEKYELWLTDKNPEEQDVIALKLNNSISILPVREESIQVAAFHESSSTNIQVYDPSVGNFVPTSDPRILPEGLPYSNGLGLVFQDYDVKTYPAEFDQKLSALVKASRELGVMIPSTSYIVVERSSQWKTLQLKEQQRLGTSEGLEFEDDVNTPAPSLGIMALLLFVLFWLKEKRAVPMSRFVRK